MKKFIAGFALMLFAVPFISFATASPCVLSVSPQQAPLGTTQNITLTLSGAGMSGSFVVPLIVGYSNKYTLTMPYTSGSCSASVYGTSTSQPR